MTPTAVVYLALQGSISSCLMNLSGGKFKGLIDICLLRAATTQAKLDEQRSAVTDHEQSLGEMPFIGRVPAVYPTEKLVLFGR